MKRDLLWIHSEAPHHHLTHCDRNLFLVLKKVLPYGFCKAWLNISGRSAGDFLTKQFGVFDMPDERRAQGPKPVLRTRPVTMLTAIGLCVLIMVMRLVPDSRDPGSSQLPVSATTAAR